MIDDNTIKEFLEMFPNCPDPDHYPNIVKYLFKVFLYEKRLKGL